MSCRGIHYAMILKGESEHLFQAGEVEAVDTIGHIEMRMFGTFRAERDGFPITDKMWRRKKAATLAERLALGMDAHGRPRDNRHGVVAPCRV